VYKIDQNSANKFVEIWRKSSPSFVKILMKKLELFFTWLTEASVSVLLIDADAVDARRACTFVPVVLAELTNETCRAGTLKVRSVSSAGATVEARR
jgi:hypothetical protein